MTRLPVIAALLSAGALFPAPAFAQYNWSDDQVTGGRETASAPASTSPYGADPGGQGYEDGEGDSYGGGDGSRPSGAPTRQRLRIDPYIEANQIVTQRIEPDSETSVYGSVAAGVDASVQGRRAGGSVSLRYDRVISYGDDLSPNVGDGDSLSGIARGYGAIAPGVTIEAGGLAARTRVDSGGGATVASGQPIDADNEARVYSVYAGPSISTRMGAAEVSANYRFGYNRVEEPAVGVVDNTVTPIDVAQESVVHSANARVGIAPQAVLPVGVGIGGGAYQEDVSNSDQRVRDLYARADVTVPVGPGLAVVGGVGYENVEVSNRDVVRDTNGDPVLGADGRYQTDENSPRRIAFETEGLIWDVGVVWKPSRRTQLEAHYGRRYDSDSYYGTFSWQASSRSAVNASVYNSISGFGGVITNSLANLPVGFEASRNALTGDFTGCVTGTGTEGSADCLGGALSSVRSAAFRNQGANLAYSTQMGRLSTGLTLGYDRREFFGAQGTLLELADGTVDQSYYANISVGGPLDPFSGFNLNAYASYLDKGGSDLADALLLGASAAYNRTLFNNLSARAAVSIDRIDSDLVDETNASALIGLRYDF
ncbi:preprotein translocase subunit YajC [Citromicrobium bathyomarinum]|uniref:preprotein translocase subunit YajC n=1 Tax=Citromicrobium bathyomarinum TaxID=72174 RepID=UPI00315A0F0C